MKTIAIMVLFVFAPLAPIFGVPEGFHSFTRLFGPAATYCALLAIGFLALYIWAINHNQPPGVFYTARDAWRAIKAVFNRPGPQAIRVPGLARR